MSDLLYAATSLSRIYQGPRPHTALQPCDFVIQQGERVALVGRSGSGKSTLLNLLGLLDVPSAGSLEFEEARVDGMSESERDRIRSASIGFVFQSFHLLEHLTARENVELGMLYSGVHVKQRKTRAEQAMGEVGLKRHTNQLPREMSGGERQRVAIARALVSQPSVLLCDEPTGNLDRGTSAAVLDLFAALHERGIALIMVTHDEDIAASCPRIITLSDGVMTEQQL